MKTFKVETSSGAYIVKADFFTAGPCIAEFHISGEQASVAAFNNWLSITETQN